VITLLAPVNKLLHIVLDFDIYKRYVNGKFKIYGEYEVF